MVPVARRESIKLASDMSADGYRLQYRTTVDKAGRMVLPAEARKRSGIKVGDPVFVEADGEGIHVLTLAQLLERVQAAFAPYKRPGESVVEELIRERREEAAKE